MASTAKRMIPPLGWCAEQRGNRVPLDHPAGQNATPRCGVQDCSAEEFFPPLNKIFVHALLTATPARVTLAIVTTKGTAVMTHEEQVLRETGSLLWLAGFPLDEARYMMSKNGQAATALLLSGYTESVFHFARSSIDVQQFNRQRSK